MNVEIVKLHEHQELMNDAIRILNHEWPRSENARMHSLTDSRDDLPCCLLLVTKDNHMVIGHSKLTKVHGQPKSAFIENVVVEKTRRGCGFGRKLMELSEHYAYKQGYQHIHLSTHDKCKFYEHLGYQYSSPVSPVRANAKLLTAEQFSALQSHFGEKADNLELNMDTTQQNDDNERVKQDDDNERVKQNDDNERVKQNDDNERVKQDSKIREQNTIERTTITPLSPKIKPEDLNNCAPLPPVPPPPPFIAPSLPMICSKQPEKQYWMVKHLF